MRKTISTIINVIAAFVPIIVSALLGGTIVYYIFTELIKDWSWISTITIFSAVVLTSLITIIASLFQFKEALKSKRKKSQNSDEDNK